MSNPFTLQVTPELMQRLAGQGEKSPRRRRRLPKEKLAPLSPLSSLPAPDTYYPPFSGPQPPFASLFGGPPAVEPARQPISQADAEIKGELAPVYRAIEESEQLSQKLQKRGKDELAKVQDMARDLQEQQYRAPSQAQPCTNERANCIDCYKKNYKDPLLCSKLVQAFVACSRQAQETFTASMLS